MDKKGKAGSSALVWVMGLGVAVIFVAVIYALFFHGTQQSFVAITGNAPTGACEDFQGLTTANMNIAVLNSKNTSSGNIEYLNAPVDFVSNGATLSSGTTAKGATLTYTTLAVNPCQTGELWVLSNATVNGDNMPANSNSKNGNWVFSATDASGKVYGDVSKASRLNFKVRLAGSGTNITSSDAKSNPTSANLSLAVGQFAYEIEPSLASGAGTAWGTAKKGGIVGVDLSTTVYDKSTVRLSSGYMTVTPIACPQEMIDNDNVDACFAIPQFTGNFATLDLIGTAVTQPQIANDILVYFEDVQPVHSGSGYSYATHVGTSNKGVAQDVITIDVGAT